MVTELDIRILDLAQFQRVSAALARARGGEAAALAMLAAECRAALASPEIARWHQGDAYFPENWLALADAVAPETGADAQGEAQAEALERFELLAVCLLAMPQYQRSAEFGAGLSPNYLPLGDEDGGLREILAEDPWFEGLTRALFERAEHDRIEDGRPVSVGAPEPLLGVMTRQQVARLDELARALAAPEPAQAPLARLRDLTRRCLDAPNATLAAAKRL